MNIEDIENLQATLKSLVRSNFNINLVGINGCGKTNLVRENYFELFDESGLYLTFTDFMNKEILFRKFHEFLEILVEDTIIRTNSIIEFLASKFMKNAKFVKDLQSCESSLENLIQILKNTAFKNFLQIYEIFLEYYLITDNINKARNEISIANCYRKQRYKNSSIFEGLIVDDDLIHISKLLKEENQCPYIIIDGLDDLKYIEKSNDFVKYLNKISNLNMECNMRLLLISNFDVKTSELNLPGVNVALDFPQFVTLIFPKCTKKDYVDILSKTESTTVSPYKIETEISNEELINITYGNYIDSIANFNSYVYNIQEIKEEYGKSPIKAIIKTQVCTTFLKQQKSDIPKGPLNNLNHFEYIEKLTNDNEVNRLSNCQKILLLCAFLASETDPEQDDKLFISVKKTNIRKSNRNKQKSFSIKRLNKGINTFNFHRLFAIYSSIISIITDAVLRQTDLNVELVSDVLTLINYNLIKAVSGIINQDRNCVLDFNKKMRCNINFEFAMMLANELGIVLEDFVDFDYLNL
jgi:hypothetical protein